MLYSVLMPFTSESHLTQSLLSAPDNTSVWRDFNNVIGVLILKLHTVIRVGINQRYWELQQSRGSESWGDEQRGNSSFLHIMLWIIQKSLWTWWKIEPSMSHAYGSLSVGGAKTFLNCSRLVQNTTCVRIFHTTKHIMRFKSSSSPFHSGIKLKL